RICGRSCRIREGRKAELLAPSPLEGGLDLRRQGRIEVVRDPHPAFPSAGLARQREPVEWHELGDWLARLGQDDLLTRRGAFDEARERGLRVLEVVEDFGHQYSLGSRDDAPV